MDDTIYLGIMSGTSLDGIDIAAVQVSDLKCQFICADDFTFPESLRKQVLQLTQPNLNEVDLMGQTDSELGQVFGDLTNQFIDKYKLPRDQIIAIGSHGQTIRHRPELGFTLQIGDPNRIAEVTQLDVVADFRRRDMANGGQGAPLVPAFHKALFGSKETDRVILNIGGMANITFLPKSLDDKVLGFDTGPGNVLLDAWIQKEQSLNYDNNGEWAAKGNVNHKLLNALYSLDYFSEPPPKSTGREQFHLDWLDSILKTESLKASSTDIQATLLELTTRSICDSIKHLPTESFELYLCGGGAKNLAIKNSLIKQLPDIHIGTTEALGIHPDWVEACAFAWMAYRTINRKTSSLPEATGANEKRILGAIYQSN